MRATTHGRGTATSYSEKSAARMMQCECECMEHAATLRVSSRYPGVEETHVYESASRGTSFRMNERVTIAETRTMSKVRRAMKMNLYFFHFSLYSRWMKPFMKESRTMASVLRWARSRTCNGHIHSDEGARKPPR